MRAEMSDSSHLDSEELQALLYGADPLEGVVRCEVADAPQGGVCRAILYVRRGDQIVCEERPFRPWIVTDRPSLAGAAGSSRLEGEGLFWLHEFPDLESFRQARSALEREGVRHGTDAVGYPSPVRQFLLRSGVTFFKGMRFEDAVRMQVDIETATLSPHDPDARVLMAAVTGSRGFNEAVRGSEAEILQRLNALVKELDPDIIEGHNIFGFDLPYLARRAEALSVPLAWGRDGSEVRFASSRSVPMGGISRPFAPAYVFGRSIVDTLLAVQRYDVGRSEMSSYGLKEAAAHLGVREPGRLVLDRRDMARLWQEDPETVARYALQDAQETASLSAIVTPPDFYVAQMVPDSFQSSATGGTGEKINLLMVRAYLRRGHAIPRPLPGRPVPGGYTELRRAGLVERVVKADVESLYPSLMLAREIAPSSDRLGAFLPMLRELTARRLDAKARKASTGGLERAYWDSLQASYKILINSFYGYLGAAFFFNDPDAAERVTRGGQELVQQVVREIEQLGGNVVEVDTDGVYFQPPPGVETLEEEEGLIRRVSERLPEGIHLAHDGRWRAMISLKVKNYVLFGYDGTKVFKGAALRSRADERFGQEFLARAVDLIAEGRKEEVGELYRDYMRRIEEGRLQSREFCRRERVTAKALQGRSLQRAADALEGASQGDYLLLYRRVDGTLARIEDYAGDEDREYLKEKLYRFACRLEPALGEDLDRLCPPPRSSRSAARGQQSLDLFGPDGGPEQECFPGAGSS
jgi:DNA polymerase elongation subunit (family B)